MSLAETLLWLCKIPSPIGEERALCDRVSERLNQVRLAAPIRRYGESIVVPLTRGSGGPHVALAGHLDVVRTEHEGPARIEGDKLYGAGAADMKSGLALMLDLAENPTRPNVDLTLVFYAREEGPFAENELGPVLAQDPELSRARCRGRLEPSDNRLQLGCSGSLHATVRFRGRTAHSARPWQGENAIQKAAGVLARLAAEEPRPHLIDGLEWRAVISATMASGGRGRNIIPDLFELNLNHRFPPLRSAEDAQAYVRALVGDDAEVEFTDVSPVRPATAQSPADPRLGRERRGRGRAQASLDGRRTLRRPRHPRRQLWSGHERASAPEKRVDRAALAGRRAGHPEALARQGRARRGLICSSAGHALRGWAAFDKRISLR